MPQIDTFIGDDIPASCKTCRARELYIMYDRERIVDICALSNRLIPPRIKTKPRWCELGKAEVPSP